MKLKQLFLNYCDFSVETGAIHITQSNLIKLLKDSQVLDGRILTLNKLSIILSKEFKVPANHIKSLTFEQYLNTILRIAEFKDSEGFAENPKQVLLTMLYKHLIPVIEKIEGSIENEQGALQVHTLYTVSDASLRMIILDNEVKSIFKDISPLLTQIYQKFFKQELIAQTGPGKVDRLLKQSLKSLLAFLKEFELCP